MKPRAHPDLAPWLGRALNLDAQSVDALYGLEPVFEPGRDPRQRVTVQGVIVDHEDVHRQTTASGTGREAGSERRDTSVSSMAFALAGFASELQKRNFAATAAMIARVPLFHHLRPAQLAELTALLKPRLLPARYTVIRRGEHPDAMYFIDDGQVVIRATERRIVRGPGSFFGELALLEGRPRQSSIITLTACRLLELRAGEFHRLLAGDPSLRQTILDEAHLQNESDATGG